VGFSDVTMLDRPAVASVAEAGPRVAA
jgi:hypothetical protein